MDKSQPKDKSKITPLTISIPHLNSQKNIDINQSLVIVGANGSGKTQLSLWLESRNENIVRSSSVKLLDFSSTLHPYEYTDSDQKKEEFSFDFDSLLGKLAIDHTQQAVTYFSEVRNSILTKEETPLPPNTKFNHVKALWEKILKNRILHPLHKATEIVLSVSSKDEKKISTEVLSTGERVLFYLISKCILAPENGIIIIDEPELHLHKSILIPLCDAIEASRPDCKFIYITHDLDFVATKENAKKIWLKSYDGEQWDWEEVEPIEGFSEELQMEILGNRKPILFVEGEQHSQDTALYRALLTEFLIIPVGGCSKVIETVKGLREGQQLHNFKIYGIIDRDRRTDTEIESLKRKNIFTLEVAEVENLFCTPAIVNLIAAHQGLDAAKKLSKVKAFIFEKLKEELEHQIGLHCENEVKHQLSLFNQKENSKEGKKQKVCTKEALESNYKNLTINIDVTKIYEEIEKRFNLILKNKNYEELLKIYNRKSLAGRISSIIELQNGKLPSLAARLIQQMDDCESIKEALLPSFQEFIDGAQARENKDTSS